MASIKARGKSFQFTVAAGRDSHGKQIFKYKTYTPTATSKKEIRKEVQKAALEFEEEVKSGKYLDGDSMTFLSLVKLWEKNYALKNLAPHTLETYEDILRLHYYSEIGNLKVSKITALHIQNVINRMTDDGAAPATVRRAFNIVKSILQRAYKWGIVAENVACRCDLPKGKKTEMRYWTVEEAREFLDALTKTYHYPCEGQERVQSATGKQYEVSDYMRAYTIGRVWREFFTLVLNTGMRRGEMCGLRWCDVDFKNQTVSVNQVISQTKHGPILKEPKTESSRRTIAVPKSVMDSLKNWKKEQMRGCINVGEWWVGERGADYDLNYVFTRTDGSGRPIRPDSVGAKFHKIIQAYNFEYGGNLPDINFHGTRHTAATLLIAEGVDIVEVSHRLGHSKTSTTEDIYAHQLTEVDQHAADVLENLFQQKTE